MITRRQFLIASGAAVGSASAVGLYTWQVEPHWLEIVRRELTIANLPASLVGASLVQLSDIHVGPVVHDQYIVDTFHRVAALAPDIVVYTGDFTSYEPELHSRVERVYCDAPRGRLATLGILGNHDYGPQWSHPEMAAQLIEQLNGFGIQILRNSVADVSGLQVVGLDDLWANQFHPATAFEKFDTTRSGLVLSHNPDTVDLLGWSGYAGWILSGHTHGGQCKPPFLPPPMLPVQNRRYTSGEFELSAGRRMYISRGVGYLRQVRFNCRPEVTVFSLSAGHPEGSEGAGLAFNKSLSPVERSSSR